MDKPEWKSFTNIVRIKLELDQQAEDKRRVARLGLAQISFDKGDYAAAFEHWWQVSENDPTGTAVANLALMFEVGRAPSGRDVPRALRLYEQAAEKKVPMALHRLGYYLFVMSNDDEKERQRGYGLIKAAAGTLWPEALFDFGMIQLHGIYGTVCDPRRGLRFIGACFSVCMEMDGAQFDVAFEAAFQIGTYLGLSEHLNDALYYALYAAENGHALGQDLASQLYLKGAKDENNEEIDADVLYASLPVARRTSFYKAVFWLEKAAKQGVVSSMRDLAVLIDAGSVPGSDERVMELYSGAAEKNDDISQYQLGLIYLEGEIATQDLERAAELLRKSADQGFVPALEHLLLEPESKLSDEQKLEYKLKLVTKTKTGTERERKAAVRTLKSLGSPVECCEACFELRKSLKVCSICKGVSYCSEECQKRHWPSHKQNCSAPPSS